MALSTVMVPNNFLAPAAIPLVPMWLSGTSAAGGAWEQSPSRGSAPFFGQEGCEAEQCRQELGEQLFKLAFHFNGQ